MLRDGQQIGSYRLIRLLGKGSFAEVYLGKDRHLNAQVAIKLLHAQLVESGELEKFQQEARTIARLEHPNIVRIRHFAVEAGTPYLVMDYAPNGSLRQRITRGRPASPAAIAPSVQQVAEALQHAHDQKLIHRDIKPENMLLGRRNEVLLSDFGIAVALQQTRSHLTVQGFSGTAVYAAPEQFKGQVSPASDQYALGVVVYEWLIGERPFQGDDLIAIGMAKVQQPPPPLREKIPALSPAIEEIVLTALATDPKARFATVRAFATAFAQAAQSAAPAPFVVSAPAPVSAPQPAAPAPIQQATIPVAHPPFPQAAVLAMPAEANILVAPTRQTGNPLTETIRVAPQAQPGNALPPTQVEIVEQPQSQRTPSGPAPQKPPAAPPKPHAGSLRRLPKGRRGALIFGGLGYFALVGVTLKETYTITTTQRAVNASRQQVYGSYVSPELEEATQAAPATGGPAPATQAHGTLHFYNNTSQPVFQPQGSVLNDRDAGCTAPIQMVLDAAVTIPASPDGQYGQGVGAPAHVLQYGSIGNIPAFPGQGCFHDDEGQAGGNGTSFSGWVVQNETPFTGGHDAIVQQSDIDTATHTLLAANHAPDPRQEMKLFLDSNERWLDKPAPSCQPKVSSDHAAGDKTGEALVTLSYLCTGYKYDYDGALRLATNLLTERASRGLISLFKLKGEITATVTSVALVDPQHATIRLTVAVQGIWALRL